MMTAPAAVDAATAATAAIAATAATAVSVATAAVAVAGQHRKNEKQFLLTYEQIEARKSACWAYYAANLKKKDPNESSSGRGRTWFMDAASFGKREVVAHMLENHVVNVSKKNADGETALMCAVGFNNAQVVSEILSPHKSKDRIKVIDVATTLGMAKRLRRQFEYTNESTIEMLEGWLRTRTKRG